MATRNYDLTAQDTQAQKSNRAEYEELLAFIKTLALPGSLDGRRSDKNERDGLTTVIETFQKISQIYYDRAEELIQSDGDIHPLERSEKFYRVLDHLRDHALLLADIIRFHPRGILSKTRRGFLKKAIQIISQRLTIEENEPLLLPLFTSSFGYFHFRYMNGFGLIGIPPEIALNESNNEHLSVLWHEVAGHALAIGRETQAQQLASWAAELAKILQKKPEHWNAYRELYRQSELQNLPNRKELEAFNILSDFETLYKEYILTDEFLDSDLEWHKLWLTEFLEDIFWIVVPTGEQQAQETALQAMANALILRYPKPEIGDPQHPPMLLRLLVGTAYLNPDDPERIEEMIQPFYYGRNRGLDQKERQTFQYVAKEIADFCRQHIIATESLYSDTIKDAEKELVRFIFASDSTPQMLEDVVAGIAVTYPSPEPNDEKLFTEIADALTIDDLLNITFVYTDPHGGRGDPGSKIKICEHGHTDNYPRHTAYCYGPHTHSRQI